MRAVLDPNVIISALLSPRGRPAELLSAWIDGTYEMVASPLLLAELERALGYRKLRGRISPADVTELIALIREQASLVQDPVEPAPLHSADPGDDYLIALAAASGAFLVSGDDHLQELPQGLPVYSPATFLKLIEPSP